MSGRGEEPPPKRRRGRPPGVKAGASVASRRAAALERKRALERADGSQFGFRSSSGGPGGGELHGAEGSTSSQAPINMHNARKAEESLLLTDPQYEQVYKANEDMDEKLMRRLEDAKDALNDAGTIREKTFRLLFSSTARSTGQKITFLTEDAIALFLMILQKPVQCWSLRIQGFLMEESDQKDHTVASLQKSTLRGGNQYRFSHFFKRVIIELDKDAYPGRHIVEWNRSTPKMSCDAIEITRPGQCPESVKMILEVDNLPERFRMTEQLKQIVRSSQDTETRNNVFKSVWSYVDENQLLEKTPLGQRLRIDDKIRSLLDFDPGVVHVSVNDFLEEVKSNLVQIEPIEIVYKISPSRDRADGATALNVKVYVVDHYKTPTTVLVTKGMTETYSSEIAQYRSKSLEYLEQITVHSRRQELFENFSKDPGGVIQSMIFAKTRDDKAGRYPVGKPVDGTEEKRRDPLKATWIPEVIQRLSLKSGISSATAVADAISAARAKKKE